MVARGWEGGMGRGERMNRWCTEDFQDSEILLYDTTVVDINHYKFIQNHRMYNTKSGHYCTLWTMIKKEKCPIDKAAVCHTLDHIFSLSKSLGSYP